MKKMLVFAIFVFFASNIFAQERAGYIKPNISIGFCSEGNIDEPKGSISFIVDIDFILNFGLTFGIGNVLAFSSQPTINLTSIRIGYTWDDKRNYINQYDAFPSIGINFIMMPNLEGTFGGEINITKWINNSIGLFAFFNCLFYKNINDETKQIFLGGIGYTIKL